MSARPPERASDALRELAHTHPHECPDALLTADEVLGEPIIRCLGCQQRLWPDD